MDRCIICGGVPVVYCDYHIGWPRDDSERAKTVNYACIDTSRLPFTCDAPVCSNHSKHVGNLFVCGKLGGHDSIDHCQLHRNAPEPDVHPMSDDDASRIRRDIHAQLRRMMMRYEAAR